jgi:hypothetical protein
MYGYHVVWIAEMIAQQTQPISLKDVEQIQGDNLNFPIILLAKRRLCLLYPYPKVLFTYNSLLLELTY